MGISLEAGVKVTQVTDALRRLQDVIGDAIVNNTDNWNNSQDDDDDPYRGVWHRDTLDPDFEFAINELQLLPGRVLDIGCGLGSQIIALAELGWQAVGVDINPNVVKAALSVASARGLVNASFLEANILLPLQMLKVPFLQGQSFD